MVALGVIGFFAVAYGVLWVLGYVSEAAHNRRWSDDDWTRGGISNPNEYR